MVTPRANFSNLIDNQLEDKVVVSVINRIVIDKYHYSFKHRTALQIA